jgi:hypothetical protein
LLWSWRLRTLGCEGGKETRTKQVKAEVYAKRRCQCESSEGEYRAHVCPTRRSRFWLIPMPSRRSPTSRVQGRRRDLKRACSSRN